MSLCSSYRHGPLWRHPLQEEAEEAEPVLDEGIGHLDLLQHVGERQLQLRSDLQYGRHRHSSGLLRFTSSLMRLKQPARDKTLRSGCAVRSYRNGLGDSPGKACHGQEDARVVT